MAMMQIKMALKAFKLKRKLKRLKLAKENTLRIEQGLDPIIPWTEQFIMYAITMPKEFVYKALCPCCVYDRYRHEKNQRPVPKSCLGRITYHGAYENQVFKSILGFLGGVFINYLIYLYMIYHLRLRLLTATIWCLLLGNVLTLGLAFSDVVRCVVMLILPSVFSSKGRTAILAAAMIMVFNGPLMNAGENAMRLGGTIQCGQELLKNTTKAVVKEALTPIFTIYNMLVKVMKQLAALAKKLKKAFMAVVQIFRDIIDTIKQVFGWLANVVKECNEKIGTPAKKCYKSIDDAVDKCKVALGWFFSWLCYIAHIGKVDTILEPIKAVIKNLVNKIKQQLYVDLKFDHHMNYTFEQSKSITDVRKEIMKEIRSRVDFFDFAVELSDVALFMVFFMLVFKAWTYRYKYLVHDRFDNAYITFTVRDIDERRSDMGKETLLPLRRDETKLYVKTNAWSLAHSEKKKLFTSLVFFFSPAMQAAFYMFMDTTLFWLLNVIRKYGAFDAEIEVPANIELRVKGSGFLASMYRTIIKSFNPLLKILPKVDTTPCLPFPSAPDYAKYKKIWALLGLVLALILLEAYGLRVRHVICSWFTPNREKERAVWLYNSILRQRGGIMKLMRRRLREKYGTQKLQLSKAEQTSLVEYLATRYNWLRQVFKWFGYTEKKYCVCCSKPGFQDDYDTFKHCQTPDCSAIYCEDCFRDLGNVCEMCSHPIEYDSSEVDEELDSSEEEEILRKREYARQAALLKPSTVAGSEDSLGVIDSQDSQIDAANLFHYTQKMAARQEAERKRKSLAKDRVSVDIFTSPSKNVTDSESVEETVFM
ncbi:DC-STAMP domain-containing protein 2 [Hypsibius exemplaris]|uniref:DC-STAMP domain-containing protein 2 n=1 Tax=Hypsibius exemplaris TaxID=2072580 RepID=A0A1W0WD00_HYPEX|nr:DC-STAMP domain-containing protein 2 [Hypsibius exemplaris]